jgi:tetratricopeptide (TPR) repeat protein
MNEFNFGAKRAGVALGVIVLAAAALTASASLIAWQNPGFLLGTGNGLSRWMENAEAGSGVEKALFRLMKLPGGEALYRRSPREARPELTALINSSKNSAALYSLRALEDEKALDFDAAERDWKTWAQKADVKPAANLDLANFYDRRLKPQEELAALEAVGQAPATPRERWTAAGSQQSWKAWGRTFYVIAKFALPRSLAMREYTGWEQRYPQVSFIYGYELDYDLDGKDLASASALIARYRKAFPEDKQFPVSAEARVEAARGSAKDGLAVYDRSFEPLWPAELVKSYYDLLVSGHQILKTRDLLRARLAANPDGGTDALKDAAKLFYIFQQQGQLEAAKAVLAGYRERKDARGAAWSDDELYTLARLLEAVQNFPEAARYYYALAAKTQTPNANEKGMAGLARILLTAPEQPLRVGAGNLALYKSIATMDRGPGYLNGILSLFFNSQQPASEYADQDQLAAPYFHRAKAAELIAEIDRRFPQSAARAELHQRLMTAYMAYVENDAAIREGTLYLSQFPNDTHRVEVALQVGDIYSRANQSEKEFALYKALLKELAAKADGVPLGEQGDVYASGTAGAARSAEYAQVLNRYLSRLVALQRLPEALELLRGELDRNPQDPGLYEKLAGFLDQNRLNSHEEEVYQRAIEQFQETGWYAKLARFYLRERRNADYGALSRKVTGIFSGSDLEEYLKKAPAPDSSLALEVNRFAHERFPHDLAFVRNLIAYYNNYKHPNSEEVEKLLWEHWAESTDLRDQLFELLSRTGRLDAQLEALRRQAPEIKQANWSALAQSNPAAERFWLESCLWQSRYEDAVGAADALSAEFPADDSLGNRASSLHRSLAYFHPEETDKAVEIEKRLLSAWPDDLERLARIGDIYADRGRMSEAAPYWTRMAEVHPGEAGGYLQSATVFWDYFDFASASAQLRKARERLQQPALFGYEAGAVEESQGNPSASIKEYVAGALAGKPSEESRARLLTLAARPDLRASVESETSGLLKTATPTSAAIELRVSLLDAEHRATDIAAELKQVVAQTDSFDVLDCVTSAARSHALPEVEQLALRRQIALTTDPVHTLELRYQLVDLLQQHNPAAAAAEEDAIYREHPKVLGVVRATVDYDWAHDRRPQAVTVLLDAADAAYPELKQKFQLEAARKLTELSEYARAKTILETLLKLKPLDATIEAALADNYAHSGDQAGLEAFYKSELVLMKATAMDRGEKTERLAQLRRGMIAAASLLGNWSEVADQYIELINAYPGDASLAQEAALAAGAHGQREKLLDFYRKTVDAAPRDARWSILLARLETALEDYPATIDAYAKAIHVRPEQKDLYESKADLEERLYRLDDAVADYEQLYKLSYHDPQWMVKEAEARARQGRNAEAVKALEAAWITGRPPRATNYVEVATRLEHWGLLDDARNYAEQCVTIAGADLLVSPGTQSCATIYAQIMARLRQSDAAFTRLALARMQAESVPLTAVAEQVLKDGFGAITNEDWRRQRVQQHTEQAKSAFAQALKSMAEVAGTYYTPEEKAQFAAWLQAKRAMAANGSELRVVYLPAIQVAGLLDMESDMLWDFVEKSGDHDHGELNEWLQRQRQRVQLEGVGAKLESLAATRPHDRQTILHSAAGIYRTLGDDANELRILDTLAASGRVNNAPRYYQLLLAARPQELVRRAAGDVGAQRNTKDNVAQFLVANAKPELVLSGIAARSSDLPPVWKKAYTGLTGLYLRVHSPQVREGFNGALGGELTIGERIAHAPNRNERLAGETWFYYGSRYGEYLDEEKDAQAEGYLESELEHTPESAGAYAELADYSAQVGRAEAALADYQHSLDRKSDQPAILDSIATLEWKQGRQADALAAWQLAVKKLAAEMDARHVPESFWNDFVLVLGDVAAHGQLAAIDEQVDAMLRIYIARNGEYRAEPLLKAGYQAHGDSMNWLFAITAAASDQSSVLNSIIAADWQSSGDQKGQWIREGQMSQILGRIAELERRKAQNKPGEYNWSFENAESRWITALLDEKKFAEASAELTHFPEAKLKSSQWLAANLRIAEAEHRLPQLVAQWKKQPSSAPGTSDLQSALRPLSEPSKRVVMRFVYERSLDARELTAPNFLGLAAIDIDEGDGPGAVSLLKRLTLISGNPRTDADSAASLLESKHKFSEAIQFLQPLAQSSPWETSIKIRLAVAMLAVNAQDAQAIAALAATSANSKATYAERSAAAKALKGHGVAGNATGSAELNLLVRDNCPSEDEVGKAFFVQARMSAAACATDKNARERLLFSAITISPGDVELRLEYLSAAFEASQNTRALVAAEPVLGGGSFYGQRFSQGNDSLENEGYYGQNKIPSLSTLHSEEASKLTWFAIHAREKRHEDDEALTLLRSALSSEINSARRRAFEAEEQRLETEVARVVENAARAPNIHRDLEQDRIVRPRLLLGDPFVPRKKTQSKEDAE